MNYAYLLLLVLCWKPIYHIGTIVYYLVKNGTLSTADIQPMKDWLYQLFSLVKP